MEAGLDSDQEAFVRHAIETGRFHRPEDAVEEALSLWKKGSAPALALRPSRLLPREAGALPLSLRFWRDRRGFLLLAHNHAPDDAVTKSCVLACIAFP